MERVESKDSPDYMLQTVLISSIGILSILEIIAKNKYFENCKKLNPDLNFSRFAICLDRFHDNFLGIFEPLFTEQPLNWFVN